MISQEKHNDLFESGMAAYINKDYSASIDKFTESIERGDTSYRVWVSRGAAQLRAERIDQAIADFDRAIAKSPDHARAYHLRALAYDKSGQWDLALADLDSAIGLDPEYGAAYLSRAMVFDKVGRDEEALEDRQMVTHLTELQLGRYAVDNNVWQSRHLELEADEVVSELER